MSTRSVDSEVLSWIAEGVDSRCDDERFERLALEIFAHQYACNAPYRRLCDTRARTPNSVTGWREIPAVPTGAFKEARLASFPPERDVRVFRTSGSSTEARGALHLDSLELYDASLLASFRAFICPDVERIRFLILALPLAESPDSSLSYMFDHAAHHLGKPDSGWYVHADGWNPRPLIRDLSKASEPVAVVGTAFAFVHLLDAIEAQKAAIALPPESRVMETGGFKGQARELSRDVLHGEISRALGVPIARIINQYGMCELASQFYEDSLLTGEPSTIKRVAPWVRTRVIDPASGLDLPLGEVGVLVHYDLANTGSVLAVETSDAGRMAADGFEMLGRIQGAEARGCSIAADAMLAGR